MTEPLDLIRVALLFVAAGAQTVMGNWPQIRGWARTVPERSARLSLPIVPWPPFFAIWGVIFIASFAFAAWSAQPGNLADPLLRTLGWLAIAAWTLNFLWEWHVPRRDIDATSVGLIATALVVSLIAMAVIDSAGPLFSWRYWLGAAPIELLAGWISAATFVNAGTALKGRGVVERTGWQLALLAGGGLLGSGVAYATGSFIYAGAVAWALAGIVVGNLVRDRNGAIRVFAALLVPVVLAAAWMGT